MSLNFPTNPSPGQVYTDLATGLTYIWNNAIGAFESAEQPPTIVSETQPQTEVAGRLWFKPSSKEFKIYDGTVWITPGIINPIIMSNTAPTQRPNTQSLQNGDLWWDTVGGTLYVYYNDGDSNQWVSATPTPGIADLPPGSATNPGLSFQNDTNTGLFSSGDGNVSVTINGEQKLSIDVDGLKAVSTNGAWKIPDGTILQRPIVPTPGMIRFNIDWNRYEGYDGTVWSPLAGALVITSLIPPSDPTPNEGDFWFNEDTGGLFLYYNDGNSSQWVQVGGTDLVDGILDVSLGGTGASTAADARTNLGVISKSGDVFTGPVGITAGTAGAPGLYVSGDINTGIFSPGADQLSITTGGTAKITIDSDSVSIPNLDFTQNGTGTVTRTVDSKLKDVVSVKDFGAVGDGLADDTAAVTNAIASQRPLDWGGLNYKITSPISQTVTKPVQWYGGGAVITYAGAHTGDAIFLNDTAGVGFVIDNLTIDGSKLCNRVLCIENNTSNTTPSTFTANNLSVKRAKRLNTFSGGEAVLIRGAFEYATFNGGIISDCELPAGQGTSGSVGIRGIGVTWYSTTSYVKRLTLNGVRIEKIYSSDPAYTDDQDGVSFFSPNESGSGKLESDFVAMGGCRFINCYGRAIKTQCRNTQVRDCHFQRTEGPTDGNGEINSQTGTCVVNACSFSYRNGKTPGAVVAASTTSNWKAGATVTDNEVDLDASTTLPIFFQSFPSGVVAPWTQMTVSRNRILGTVTQLVDFLCNGEKNFLTVEDNWVEEIGVYSTTSTQCLVYTRASGGSAPYFAHLSLNRNIYAGSNTVQLARDTVTGNAMRAMYSAYGNYGFENGWNASVSGAATTLQSSALPARLTDARNITTSGDQQNYGYFGMQTKLAAAGATVTFNFRANNCSLIILQVSSARTAYALFTADSSITTISSGTGVTMGTTTNPAGSNTFNVWRSNTGEISVENTTGTARVVSAWVFAPN